ncbi:MAG: UDP-3-O-(3-hydroxymyristoyl)glucosamine N-acyltransferase [Deltaproteobacteria bacterium]|nr:UDP-3-O-(3-hydroxymyristoyl)glucosamine N-acyltransferase [Deltaproteobacteria bacterium]MBW2285076.1 UDP-3-O-(3-hydroxymyristoyl)glucosamine N-acyltransferase [Deltaproteobacteria bacterium]
MNKIAALTGGNVVGDAGVSIRGINSLEAAVEGEVSFYTGPRYKEALMKTRATALIVSSRTDLFAGPQLVVADPSLAHAKVAAFFVEPVRPYPGGVSKRASIHESARIGRDASVYPLAYVGEGAVIGEETILFPGVYVGDRVRIGKGCVLYPNVSVMDDCRIGNQVILHAGTVIGGDGFGFAHENGVAVKIPQRGIVQIDDHVEIGANNCIDRAVMGKTWIRSGVKTDNLVHVGHNVAVGENSILIAQVGISGSVDIGRGVVLGGQVGVSDHVKIGDGTFVVSQSGIPKSLPPGSAVAGSPTMPYRLWLKTRRLIQRLPQTNERLRKLEKRLADVESRLGEPEGRGRRGPE